MKIDLSELKTKPPKFLKKEEIQSNFHVLQEKIGVLQNMLFQDKSKSVLVIFQGIDASGKDSVIEKVFASVNAEGVQVKSFKEPTQEEKNHDFLWRIYPHLPEKGKIHIHNRSYYEDIIMPLLHENLPERVIKHRINLVNAVEKNLVLNKTKVLKFFLHISEKEQHRKIEERKNNPDKQWKYKESDNKALKKYDDYMHIYERVIKDCSKSAPWNIIPSDKKWYRNYLVAKIVADALEKMTEDMHE